MEYFKNQKMCKTEYAVKLGKMVDEKPGFVVSTTFCPYCSKAKKVFDYYKIPHSEILLDNLDYQEQEEYSNCIYGDDPRRSVP